MSYKNFVPLLIACIFLLLGCNKNEINEYDVIIIGGGTSGVMAAIQAARMDQKILLLEETAWLGGMITSAGVSAIDGNYELASGLWEEFRQRITAHYGGPEEVKTGWVSNVLFEPDVAASILDDMVATEPHITAIKNSYLENAIRNEHNWEVHYKLESHREKVAGKIVIDATELGDVVGMLGLPYDIGMDSRSDTGEKIAPEKSNKIIQDLTYVAVLEKLENSDPTTLKTPEGYDPEIFRCTCRGYCDPDRVSRTLWPCDKMLEYGKLPGGKIMINWPIYGNDFYANTIEMDPNERARAYEEAKHFTKCYIHYLQTELGFDEWRIAKNVFPTKDGFPMMPYHRESRRIKGIVQFDLNDLAQPYEQDDALYKTGIAVGDYPIDHHHAAYPESDQLPDLHFYPVPSYSVPLGSLIPQNSKGLIVAEKSISVTHIVNGTTRLQPVCMLIGQAAGVLAALSNELNLPLEEVPVRSVQRILLSSDAFILPYADVSIEAPEWAAIQKVGATGLIKGEGKNVGWKNYTFFHPDSTMTNRELVENLSAFTGKTILRNNRDQLTIQSFMEIIKTLNEPLNNSIASARIDVLWKKYGMDKIEWNAPLKRREVALLLDYFVDPFSLQIDHHGRLITDK